MKKEKLESISKLVEERLGSEYEVIPDIRYKNNNTIRYGIMVKLREDFIGATIYIDDERAQWEVEELAEYILHAYEEIGPVDGEIRSIAESLFDKEELLRNVSYAAINKEKNTELLKEAPHKEFLDLALIYKWYSGTDNGTATVTVTNELMKKLDIEFAELEAAAIVNYLHEKVDIINMSEFLCPICGESEEESPMWVVKSDRTGAAVIAHPIFFRQLAEDWESDFVVFPSSVYEVIVYKTDDLKDEEAMNSLKEMVAQINDNEVEAEEILSYNVYCFDRKLGRLAIA